MEIWLIRHTTPDVKPGTCYGQLDLDVNNTFNQEVKVIQTALNGLNPNRVYSSPLIRCAKLAQELYKDKTIEYNNNLMELNFGDWEGQQWDEIPQLAFDTWAKDFISVSPPKGESFQELTNRIYSFDATLSRDNNDKVAIVTHSGVMRVFLMKYLGISTNKIFSLHLNYGSIIKVKIHSKDFQQVEIIKG